jgi:hypothetical protein
MKGSFTFVLKMKDEPAPDCAFELSASTSQKKYGEVSALSTMAKAVGSNYEF